MSWTIGVMDSGAGGLTILRSIQSAVPGAQLLYFADQKYAPYGSLSTQQIIDRLLVIGDFFVRRGCQMMVVACNTATVAGIAQLREHLDIPVVGVEPAVKPACSSSVRKRVSVLATLATTQSPRLNDLIATWRFDSEVEVLASRTLASLVDGMPETEQDLQTEVALLARSVLAHQSDALVLACTHYPLVKSYFEQHLTGVSIVEPSAGVTAQVLRLLESSYHCLGVSEKVCSEPKVALYSNAEHEPLRKSLEYWWASEANCIELLSI